MKKNLIVVLLPVIFLAKTTPSYAARLSLDPITKTASLGATFNVAVRIDTAGEPTSSSEALLSFDANTLEIVDVAGGDFYPENLDDLRGNQLRIGGTVIEPLATRTGTGILATINFRGKRLDSSSVNFVCTPGDTTDSNINKNDPDSTDILDCQQLVAGNYTIAASASETTTPTATPTVTISPSATQSPTTTATPIKTTTPTPAKAPVAGNSLPTAILLGSGLTMILLGIFTLL